MGRVEAAGSLSVHGEAPLGSARSRVEVREMGGGPRREGQAGDVGSPETWTRERRRQRNRLEQEMDENLLRPQPRLAVSLLFPQSPFLVPLTPCSFISPHPLASPTPAGDPAPGPDGSRWRERDVSVRDQRKPATCHLLAEGGKSSRCPRQGLPTGFPSGPTPPPPSPFCKLLSGFHFTFGPPRNPCRMFVRIK